MRVVSGIQPTGKPHLGNYLGAIRNYVKFQDDADAAGGECLIFIADLHALSLPHDPRELHASTLELVAPLVASGLAGGVHPARCRPYHEPARWIGQDEQIRPIGYEPDQSGR